MLITGLPGRERVRTVAHVVGVLLLVCVVAAFVVYGIPQAVGADHSYVVLSGSMEPAMSPGDAVIVAEAAPAAIVERDIITFDTGSDTPTTHRVVDVVESGGGVAYVTKGDANEDPDAGTVPHERVIGEVVLVIPLLGYAVRFLNTPLGFVVAVVVPLGLLVGSDLWSIIRSVGDDAGSAPSTDAGSATSTDAGSAAVTGAGSATDGGAASAAGTTTAGSGTAAVAADTPTEPTAGGGETDGETGDDGEATLTLTRSSLQVIAFVFGAYLPYTAVVAYTRTSAWAITVAIATGIGFLFVLALYVTSGGGAAGGNDGGSPDDDAGEETPVEEVDDDSRVVVPSLAPADADSIGEPGSTAAADPAPAGDATAETGTVQADDSAGPTSETPLATTSAGDDGGGTDA